MVRRYRWILVPFAGYCTLALLVACFQRSIMYHPFAETGEQLKSDAERNRLKPWTNATGLRIGWHRPALRGPAETTVLILHGNAGSAAGREYIFDPLQAGFNADVFILDYPGFADRPGTPSKDAILAAAVEGFGLIAPRGPVVLVGESLGTGVACYLAAQFSDQVKGVILLVPYDNTVNAARSKFPWLPVGLLLRDRYASDEWLPRFGGPVVFAVAEKDEILPARLGLRLHDLYPGAKHLELCTGARHMEGANRPREFWKMAWNFIGKR